jgi:hypothetical protein
LPALVEDTSRGWQLYRDSGYTLTREEINLALRGSGHRPISRRTYAHYGKLRRHGFREYLPINQLDVKTVEDPLWDEGVRSRYPERPVSIPVQIHATLRREPVTLGGEAQVISDSGAKVRLAGLHGGLSCGSRVVIVFPRTQAERLARVKAVRQLAQTGVVELDLEFASLTSLAELTGREPLGVGTVRIVSRSIDPCYLSDAIRNLYWIFEGTEASRALCEEVLGAQDAEGAFALQAAEVRSLAMGSPMTLELAGSLSWVKLYAGVVTSVMRLPAAADNSRSASARRARSRAEAVLASFDTETVVNWIYGEQATLLRRAGSSPPQNTAASIDWPRVDGLLRQHLIPCVLRLLERSPEGFRFDLDSAPPAFERQGPPRGRDS